MPIPADDKPIIDPLDDLFAEQLTCVACEGTGKSSRGWECVPCRGTGVQKNASASFGADGPGRPLPGGETEGVSEVLGSDCGANQTEAR